MRRIMSWLASTDFVWWIIAGALAGAALARLT